MLEVGWRAFCTHRSIGPPIVRCRRSAATSLSGRFPKAYAVGLLRCRRSAVRPVHSDLDAATRRNHGNTKPSRGTDRLIEDAFAETGLDRAFQHEVDLSPEKILEQLLQVHVAVE